MSRSARKAKVLAKPKPKRQRVPKPLLPQHDLPAPFARLVTLGDTDAPEVYEEVAAQIRSRDVQSGVKQLLEMALDESYYDYYDEDFPGEYDARSYTRLHAVRTLERLGAAASPAVEPLMPLLDEEDDWLREEMPFFFAAVVEDAIEPLSNTLMNAEEELFVRAGAAESLAEIGEKHPELRARAVSLLEQALVNETEDEEVAGYIVTSLLDVNAKESLPIIEQAYAQDRVDLSIVQMPDVQEHFGLPITASYVPIYWGREDEIDEDAEEPDIFVDSSEDRPLTYDGQAEEPAQQPYVAPFKVGRNDPCPCGSGKKYKRCCGS